MKIRWPEAKFHGQSASDVQKSLAPQKLGKNRKKLFSFRKSKTKTRFFFRVGESARRFFRAGSRRGEFFAREVGTAIFSCGRSEQYSVPPSRRRIREAASWGGPGGREPPPASIRPSVRNFPPRTSIYLINFSQPYVIF